MATAIDLFKEAQSMGMRFKLQSFRRGHFIAYAMKGDYVMAQAIDDNPRAAMIVALSRAAEACGC